MEIEFLTSDAWGQTIARVIAPEGSIVGISYAPAVHA
jgi:hypothetical protein